ncbi:MAG: hypothetical protein AB7P40_09365 [Chloroflexota bacterium]
MTVAPDLERAREALALAAAEDVFWHDHYTLFLGQHPDQFVAVVNDHRRHDYGNIVAAESDLDRVIDIVKSNGLDLKRAWVRYMAAAPVHLAL